MVAGTGDLQDSVLILVCLMKFCTYGWKTIPSAAALDSSSCEYLQVITEHTGIFEF